VSGIVEHPLKGSAVHNKKTFDRPVCMAVTNQMPVAGDLVGSLS